MQSSTFFLLKESLPRERRVALVPSQVSELVKTGYVALVEAGAGQLSGFTDDVYAQAGARIVSREEGFDRADIILSVRELTGISLEALKKGTTLIGLLNPFQSPDWPAQLAETGVRALSLELVPRSTLAQKMDVLSSQANLAGYVAVLEGSKRLGRILPLMMTPAGTLPAAKVFVLGVGVAGLQAIATAKRLGARVEAFDTRPVVAEQVQSLGAKFLQIDIGETGQTAQGYATELTPEQLEKQRLGLLKALKSSDIIITTAKLFGRPSPTLITAEMVSELRNGTVIVDLAAGAGGNVAGVVRGETTVSSNGVTIIGEDPLECVVAQHASLMYGSNLIHFFQHCRNHSETVSEWRADDEIYRSCLICEGGAVVHERFGAKPAQP